VPVVVPNKEALGIERLVGVAQLPLPLDHCGPAVLWIGLVDLVDANLLPVRLVVANVCEKQMSRVVDGDVFPVGKIRALHGIGADRFAVTMDGEKVLLGWAAA